MEERLALAAPEGLPEVENLLRSRENALSQRNPDCNTGSATELCDLGQVASPFLRLSFLILEMGIITSAFQHHLEVSTNM